MSEQKPGTAPRRRRPYRQLPHTADLAWRLWGQDLPELFENAGRALSATLTDRRYLRRRATREVRLRAFDREALLVDWLNHLLYLFDIDGFLGRDFQVELLTPDSLVAAVTGESFDPARHPARTGVKAATYHQLSIVPVQDGWEATVVLDL
jgi:SHS2 domain-containing protein